MTVSMFTLFIAMCVGGVLGFFVGQFWSEFSRGKFDAKRAWEHRKSYRE